MIGSQRWSVFFDHMEITESKKVKIVAFRFKGIASAWWDQTIANRAKYNQPPIRMWDKLKRLLRQRFLSVDYQSILFDQYQHCRQENKSVTEYNREFHQLGSRKNLNETEEQLVTRFVGGLKDKLTNKLAMHPQYSLTNAINVAERLERQSTHYSAFATVSTSYIEQVETDTGLLPTPKEKEPMAEGGDSKNFKNTALDPAQVNIKCYHCHELGHKSNVCPDRKEI